MRGLIFALLLLCAPAAAQVQYQKYAALQPLGTMWELQTKTRVGAHTRVPATVQFPYPFCFSTAAAMLWDQQRCQTDKNPCGSITPTSFLAATAAGQSLPQDELNTRSGGSAVLSLKRLTAGFVPHAACNYAQLYATPETRSQDTVNRGSGVYFTAQQQQQAWRRYEQRAPYLERFYRREYAQQLRQLNPELPPGTADQLLQETHSETRLLHRVLLGPDCFANPQRDARFQVATFAAPTNPEILVQQSFALLRNLLQQNKPVLVQACLSGKSAQQCEQPNRHAFVVVAQATARHRYTGDVRQAYWVVNSWGEDWQAAHADGWVFAEPVLQSLLAEVVWLDTTQP
jgi:hypothetical protein